MPPTLIVDDSRTMRRMVIASLREVCAGGFLEAASGLEAIERLAVVPIAMVVLDLNMPDMHGLEVLAFVRRFESDIVLVVNNLSGSAQAVELDLAEWKGAIPIEMFGGSLFPRVTERPYLLTLTPYAFLWFRLRWV